MYNNNISIKQAAQPVTQPSRRRKSAPAHPSRDWRSQAVLAHQQVRRYTIATLPELLAARASALTGRAIDATSVFVDRETEIATLVVDGAVFRAHHQQIFLLRSCAACGIERFESQPLATRADLGFALSQWQPLCRHCQPEDPANWLES